jgi:hypothetical protein
MSSHHTIREASAYNSRQRCSASGCCRPRRRIGRYCSRHAQADNMHGHPQGHRLLPRDYAQERTEVAAFLTRNTQHPGILVAQQWLSDWLTASASRESGAVAQTHMFRLAFDGITPLRLLEEVAAVWLFSTRHPEQLEQDERLTYALGAAVLYLCPRGRRQGFSKGQIKDLPIRFPGTVRQEVGEHVRSSIGILLFHISDAINRRVLKDQGKRQALSTPFSSAATPS